MNKEEIKRLANQLNKENYKTLFGALLVYELGIEDLDDAKMEEIEELYDKFMETDYYTSLLNQELMEEF